MNSFEVLRAIELSQKAGTTLCISGPPGIGKTSLTEQFAAQQGEGFFYGVLNCATATLADVMGFLLPFNVDYNTGKNPDGTDKMVTLPHGRYTYPFYFLDRKTGKPAFQFKNGMLVLEEYGQGSPDVKRALAPIIHPGEKRMGQYALPASFQVVLLTNRAKDRSGVGKDFDFVINRRVEIEFTPALEPWLVWAYDNKVSPVVMAFAAHAPNSVFQSERPKDQGPWCTPRSLVDAGRTIEAFGAEDPDFEDKGSFLMQNIKGSIGETASDLMVFLKLRHQLPRFEDILADPVNTPFPTKPDGQMLVTYELASKANRENIAPIVTYMKKLPSSFAVAFMQTMLRGKGKLINTQAVGEWSIENAHLMAAIAR